MDIVFLIERDLVHNGNYDYQKCIRKYRDKLDSIVPMLSWEFGDKSVMFDRDAITGDMKVSIWTPYHNSEFLGDIDADINNNPEINKEETVFEIISINNFFGIDLEKSPNDAWKYVGEANGEKTFEYQDINQEKYVFKSCVASINEDGGTDYYFALDFNMHDAQKAVYMLEKSFGNNGLHSFAECNSHYISQIHDSNSLIEWKNKGCEITYIYLQDGGTMNIFVKTPFYNSEFLDKDEMVFEDKIVTSRGFSIPTGMEKYYGTVEITGETALFFAKQDWIDEENKLLVSDKKLS